MKKLILSFAALATMAFALTGCEDVPMPYDLGEVSADTTTTVAPAGSGTAADPYNVARAMSILKAGTNTNENVYVKGIVVGLGEFNSQYGNYTYYINDTRSSQNQLEVYRGSSLNKAKFASADDLHIGDTVVVCGAITNYNGTYEFTSGNYLYELNGKQGTPETPKADPTGTGTEADPYNVSAALDMIAGLGDAESDEVYVKGKVSSIKEISTSFGNATYYISDDGTASNALYIFRSRYIGGEKFTSEDQLKVGDVVVIRGKFVNYKGNTPETVANQSQLVSVNGGGSAAANVGLNSSFQDGDDGWTADNITLGEGATYVWKYNAKGDKYDGYWKASAYVNKKNVPSQSRLASPAFSLEGLSKATLTFQHTGKYFKNMSDEIKVQASTDGKTWTDVTINGFPTGKDWKFVDATCDLSAFAGQKTVYIAFLYTSTADAAPTWEVKNVVVK